ncbi:DoxX family membrane protein [candidate division KSB1 bacterium]|jgi:uncharacterized membrane protein YphA (DoxX/SURF4 family)|nr:DoxX family membrane protein [candidate division KSB1 bacterium]
MKRNWQYLLYWLARLILAAVFIYAGVVKILDPRGFAISIDNYQMLPYILVVLMAIILPWIEVLAGLALLIGKWIRGSALIFMVLNTVFIIALASALARGLNIDCGCFTTSETGAQVGIRKIIEDLILLIMAGYVFVKAGKTKQYYDRMSGDEVMEHP